MCLFDLKDGEILTLCPEENNDVTFFGVIATQL